jgi:hypothetical protein
MFRRFPGGAGQNHKTPLGSVLSADPYRYRSTILVGL